MTVTITPTLDALESIPAELRQCRQWVLWRNENGRKMPYSVNGKPASSTHPATWASFDEVMERYEVDEGWSGVGFVFTQDDDLCGVDLDDCRDQDGSLAPAAQKIIDDFASYCEVSPSGRGVKIIARGTKPDGSKCKRPGNGFKAIEIYDRSRYFTVTGARLEGSPNVIADAQTALDCILNDYDFIPPKIAKPIRNGSLNGTTEQASGEDRCWSYLTKTPDAISGEGGHDATLRAACETVRFDLDDAATWRIMRRWNDEKCDERWTDKELAHKVESAQDKAGHERGSRNTESRKRKASNVELPAPQLAHDGPHDLRLTATNARHAGSRGKVEVSFDVSINGESQSHVSVTTSASSVRETARELSTWIEIATGTETLSRHDRAKINQFIAQVMKSAPTIAEYFKSVRQSRPVEKPEGPSMQGIIINLAPELAGLTFKNHDGSVWSETLARSIDFREFEKRIPTALVEACERAIDYPEEKIGLSAPIGTIRQYLCVSWSEAVNALPGEVKAETGPESEAARRYAEAIVRLFSIRERWKKTYARDGSEHALDSATLAQLAREKIDAAQIDSASGWQRIHNSAIDAWYCTTPRLHEGVPTGELPDAWLAFRFELVNQLPKHSRPELPNTRNMVELGIIARRYGLTADDDPASPVSIVKERGKQRRVIVLNRTLTDLILWQWDDGNEPDESSCNPGRVTASFENDNPNGGESPLRGEK